ncbi:hypothetical protein BX600DRAFT_474857 [Xylariales sp. PMI_506]|nr:hypothetical protein BX600DRAFT_474857 [Xylariales sp. PMI_506]
MLRMKVRQITTCPTCRARKLGCDGKLPGCTQCIATGRQCPGYKLDLIFVHHKPSRMSSQRSSAKRLPQTTTSSSKVATLPHHPGSDVKLELGEYSGLIMSTYAPWLGTSSLFPRGSSPTFRICGSWVAVLPELLGEETTCEGILKSAVAALGLSIRCKDIQGGQHSVACAKAQCSALTLLRVALMSEDRPMISVLIAASMCLSLAEFILPTSDTGFMIHLEGVEKLMQHSDPKMFSTGIPYQLFIGIRHLFIYKSIQVRRSCFLEQEQWQTVPFCLYPTLPLQTLLNHAALIPSLLERFDMLIHTPSEANRRDALDLWTSFGEVLKLLDTWEQSYRQGIQRPHHWLQASQNTSHSFLGGSESIWYQSIFAANGFTHLWAFRILCTMHRSKLESRYLNMAKDWTSTPLSETETGTRLADVCVYELATRICKSMEYLMQEEAKLYGSASTYFPIRMAYKAFGTNALGYADHLNWCESLVDQLGFKGVTLSSLL